MVETRTVDTELADCELGKDPNQAESLNALGDLVGDLGLTARLPPQGWQRCERSQLAWEAGNHEVHFLGQRTQWGCPAAPDPKSLRTSHPDAVFQADV